MTASTRNSSARVGTILVRFFVLFAVTILTFVGSSHTAKALSIAPGVEFLFYRGGYFLCGSAGHTISLERPVFGREKNIRFETIGIKVGKRIFEASVTYEIFTWFDGKKRLTMSAKITAEQNTEFLLSLLRDPVTSIVELPKLKPVKFRKRDAKKFVAGCADSPSIRPN
jgi:hypothetical protein